MRVTIEGREGNHANALNQLQEKLHSFFESEHGSAEQEVLLSLAENLLIYSHSHVLLKLPPQQLLDWLRSFRAFLAERDSLLNLGYFTPDNHDLAYLLINTPDVPFLVDSLQLLFQRLQMRAIVISHPILSIQRDGGTLVAVEHGNSDSPRESFMLIEIEKDVSGSQSLLGQVRQTMEMVQSVGQQQSLVREHLARLKALNQNCNQTEFLEWLGLGNFICFGYLAVAMERTGECCRSRVAEGPLGWFPETLLPGGDNSDCSDMSELQRHRLLRSNDLVVELLDRISPLYRAEPLVYIGVREPFENGQWCEHGFIGLFTQTSINQLACNVPALKSRIMAALTRQHVLPDSYDFRKVLDIFNTFPKVELFFLDDPEMDHLVRSLVSLQRYKSIKLVFTRSLSLQGITLLMIMPREFFSSASVRRLETYLKRYFNARQIDSRVINFYSDYLSLHVRVVPQSDQVRVDVERLEKMLTRLARPWGERLRTLLQRYHGNREGTRLWQRFMDGLTAEYQAMVHPRFAVRDIRAMQKILDDGLESFDLWGPFHGCSEFFQLQFYSLGESFLNELMPYLENLNLTVVEEVDFNVEVMEKVIYIKSFSIRNDFPQALPLAEQRPKLLDILHGLRRGTIEDDYLNRLMILTGLDWMQIDVFRAYRNYYFQLGNPFTKRRVAFTLINNPRVVNLLYQYFEARFLPKPEWSDLLVREEEALMPVRMELAQALEAVTDINEDRILRSLFNLIDSTIRTNFFQRRNTDDYFLSFKISAIGIIDMPFPRPMFETYVHSSSMEGIHLRGGRIARGGIRWSDRPDDFRTEVLGLMKTQMTKNALIVPVGSKGGFVVKTPYTTREEGAVLSRSAYVTLMKGLLDLVDNRIAGDIERPAGVVVYDDPDPYLVVAADKGTAHLPDTANGVSLDYGFWLGDAFASGGSVGYDHKKLGITARGAWECVKRHFRELGKDIQLQDFTVIGIGDMSGDVFGNGMLLSKHIRLLAAFNHQHIFLDPNPDADRSWTERRRLFDLPRSTWADYDLALISPGGGVWSRSAKEIPLSPQVRAWLGVRHIAMEGDELIRRLLCAEVELLWNGGIGTYIKAGVEKNADAGDRANDNVRVNASQVRAQVVGEGGNLGLTQRARIEYAIAGGRLNTDSIDNSAGVDTSDHEVNLKILFQTLADLKVIKTRRTRDRLLHEIQDEVCQRVLLNNYTQSLCLSLDQLRCREDAEPFIELADRLSNAGLLDRHSEALPGRKELTSRGLGYVRPELAILLSYSKMHLYQAVLASNLPDREPTRTFLSDYFPSLVGNRYGKYLDQHPLRREIIATMITNRVVDQAGCATINTLVRQSGGSLVQGVGAYLVFDDVLCGRQIRSWIYAKDNLLPAQRQHELLLTLEASIAGLGHQVIEQGLPLSLDQDCVDNYRERLKLFRTHLKDLLAVDEWEDCQNQMAAFVRDGLDEDLARLMASFRYLVGFLPAVHIAETSGKGLYEVSEVMNALRNRLRFPVLQDRLDGFITHDRWDRMALSSLRSSYLRQFVALTRIIVDSGSSVSSFLAERRSRVDSYLGLIEAIKASPPATTSPYMVVLRALEALSD